jgi:protein-S-isoprenylcysteine O-methyltransferase Ste14
VRRFIALIYGLAAYLVFGCVFLYTVGFVAGYGVPKSVDSGRIAPVGEAVVVNLVFLLLFAIQHSLMARAQFKAWFTRFVPKPVERSTYIMLSNLALILLCWQWRPIPYVVWGIQQPLLAWTLIGASLLGWLIAVTSTFLINHFQLFGLEQVANNLAGRQMPPPRFRTPLFYKFVRHPLYLGFIIAFWATPMMTIGHLMLAAFMTAYILVGATLEERDLLELFGDEYRRYQARVSMLMPWRRSADAKTALLGRASGSPRER